MGLASFFSFFRGEPKSKDSNAARRQAPAASHSRWADYSQSKSQPVTALPTAKPRSTYNPGTDRVETTEPRKSRPYSIARPTSQHGSKTKNRRSWFGGRPDPQEDIPAVPRLVQIGNHHTGRPRDDKSRPGTAVTTNEVSEKQGRRHSLARSISRKKSWFGQSQDPVTVEAVPPMPVTIAQPTKAATATLPADQRRRRDSVKTLERRGSNASTIKAGRRKRSSWWASSNPDDSDSDVPPVPALVRDGTPDSHTDGSFTNVDYSQAATSERRATRGDDIKQPRPVSTASRKSYTPRSAAKGFLKSTNGASDDQRQSFRQSFHLEDESDLVCLTEEQRIEWAKLMNNEGRFNERVAPQPEVQENITDGKANRYSNAQALAALEFGTR